MKSVKIRRIGVLSLAKIYAAVMALFGLVIGVIYGGIVILVGIAAAVAQQPGQGAPAWLGGAGIVFGLLMMVFIPAMYALMGFVAGALGAWSYNLAAGMVGGMELELEPAEPAQMETVTETY